MDVDPKIAATGGGIVAAAFGWLMTRVHRALGHQIAEAKQVAVSAATTAALVEERRRADMIDIHRKLDGHIERDIEMHREVLHAMNEQTAKLGEIHVSIEHALGERPTRDEVNRLIELHQGGKG